MPVYNKLIRDRIPEVISENGQQAKIRTLSDDEFAVELEKKLQEEVSEYLQDKNAEGLADILEVIYALGEQLGHTPESLEVLRTKKAQIRGGFSGRLFLVSAVDNSNE